MRNQYIMSWESWDLTWFHMRNTSGLDEIKRNTGQSEGRRDGNDGAFVLRMCNSP